jgi:hypothetical protein
MWEWPASTNISTLNSFSGRAHFTREEALADA